MDNICHIRTGWLLDGSGNRAGKDMLLTVRDGVFERIEEYRRDRVVAPDRLTDLGRTTILPPLVDCHVHLAWSGSTDERTRKEQLAADPDRTRSRIAEHLHHHVLHGVLAVRDGGDRSGQVIIFRNRSSSSPGEPAVVVRAGPAFCRQGRYGRSIGRPVRAGESLAGVFLRAGRQCDHVKVINSGINSLVSFGRETEPQFTLAELRDLVVLAHKSNRKVMVHANGREPVRRALEAGCDSLEHGFFMGRDNLRRMADQQTTWVPTIHTIQAMADPTPPRLPGIDPDVAARTLDHQLEQLALAGTLGVPIALGTDAGCPGVLHGEAMASEIRLFLTAGFSMATVIRLASINGARLLGLEHQWGIRAGRPARFLVARTTPAMLPERLHDLEVTCLDGRACKPGSCL